MWCVGRKVLGRPLGKTNVGGKAMNMFLPSTIAVRECFVRLG